MRFDPHVSCIRIPHNVVVAFSLRIREDVALERICRHVLRQWHMTDADQPAAEPARIAFAGLCTHGELPPGTCPSRIDTHDEPLVGILYEQVQEPVLIAGEQPKAGGLRTPAKFVWYPAKLAGGLETPSKEFISSHFEVFIGCTPWNVPLVTFAL